MQGQHIPNEILDQSEDLERTSCKVKAQVSKDDSGSIPPKETGKNNTGKL